MSLQLHQLREVVEEGLRLEMDVGGVLVLGPTPAVPPFAGKEKHSSEPSGSASVRSAAGPWKGQRASPQAASYSAPHPLGDVISHLLTDFNGWQGNGINASELEGLAEYLPDLRVSVSTPRVVHLSATVQPFPHTGVGFRLTLEVPTPCASGKRHPLVPAVRAWSRWLGGPAHGYVVVSHHKQPDLSMCVCMPYEWLRGTHALIDYVSMCVSWCAKVQYQTEFNRFPGRQHYSLLDRINRDAIDEFCGCGSAKLYVECCRERDRLLGLDYALQESRDIHAQYYSQLSLQHRASRVSPVAFD